MKLLIDMNLSPVWVSFFDEHGVRAQHWSTLGEAQASDRAIMDFARAGGFIVFTHDLDFGNILAVTGAGGPSVIQVRTQDPTPEAVGEMLLRALTNHASQLERGALVTVEPQRMRVRILPLLPRSG